jgi:tetratricopeptide (TPR) repeat protein
LEKYRQTQDIIREITKQELYSAPVPVQLKKAKEFKATTHYEDARDLLQNILRINPGHREAKTLLKETTEKINANAARRARADEMFNEGMKYLDQKNYSKAIAVFRNVLRFDPTYRLAEEKIKEAAELRRKREEAQELKRGGEFFYDIGKYDEALEKFEKLLELEPDNEEAKFYIEKIKEYKTLGTFNP